MGGPLRRSGGRSRDKERSDAGRRRPSERRNGTGGGGTPAARTGVDDPPARHFKKGYGHRQPGTQEHFEMMRHLHHSGYSLDELCAAFGVSRSGYYAHLHKSERPRRTEDRQLCAQIARAFEESRGTYGTPRLRAV